VKTIVLLPGDASVIVTVSPGLIAERDADPLASKVESLANALTVEDGEDPLIATKPPEPEEIPLIAAAEIEASDPPDGVTEDGAPSSTPVIAVAAWLALISTP
jgi:hypothetical protein